MDESVRAIQQRKVLKDMPSFDLGISQNPRDQGVAPVDGMVDDSSERGDHVADEAPVVCAAVDILDTTVPSIGVDVVDAIVNDSDIVEDGGPSNGVHVCCLTFLHEIRCCAFNNSDYVDVLIIGGGPGTCA